MVCCSPSANPAFLGKKESTSDTSVSRSVATSPLILALVSQSTNWNPGGRSGGKTSTFPHVVDESAKIRVSDCYY